MNSEASTDDVQTAHDLPDCYEPPDHFRISADFGVVNGTYVKVTAHGVNYPRLLAAIDAMQDIIYKGKEGA